ncbi:TonB-linked outer membrane protein, SusC/RagA family [Prevotella communis]|uniref:TonB-linked outer membrane protein, SusC/RagA family n=1 Tax=Prevotella communis TaxID=2913614 RepID=A0A1G7RQG1_9BACT|nr:SusC/RagA family TonB-linked outer membrane protein [Prevotella communis]SDG13066.1 TonB-linked outer membrane protein, SusC/RagA family [Prevotella communis]
MEKRLTVFLTALLLSIGVAFAQNKITGTVMQDDGEPAIGATVKVVGNNNGVVTNVDGKFTIDVPSGKKLEFSYIGYVTKRLAPKNGMKVTMTQDSKVIEEVVVTGMQKQDKRLFTGAATKIDAEKAKIDGVADISRSLEGRVAGVSVQNVSGTFGTAPKIRVRGATSIYGASKPLWVVDGVVMEDVTEVDADALSSGDANTLISSAIAGLNADDIESFQVLKDGSATSIYGARAMGGVIVVTTKKGKAGQSHISYTGEFTMRLKPSYSQFNIMNSQEQMSAYREMYNAGWLTFSDTYRGSESGVYGKMYQLMNTYDPATGQFLLPNTDEAMYAYLQEAEFRNTNWFDELFSTSISQNHSISMSSGTDKAQYYTSFSVMNDPGWTERSKVQRYTANINALYNLSKKLSLNLIGNAAYRKQEAPGTTNQSADPVSGQVTRDFDINPYSYAINTSRALDPNTFYTRNYAPFNIHNELANNYMDLDVVNLKFQAELKYKPIRQLELAALGAYNYSVATRTHMIKENSNQSMAFRAMDDATMRDNNPFLYQDPDVPNSLKYSVLPEGGFYRTYKNVMNSKNFRATASYNDAFGQEEEHIVNVFGGMEVNDIERNANYFNGVGMQYEMGMLGAYDYHFFKQASEENNMYYEVSNNYERNVAFFGTATYSWKHRYTITPTVRYEGSNQLGRSLKARWLPTWNISGAWNAHEESWFADTFKNILNHATLRLSYSLTGDKPAVNNAMVIIESVNPWRPFASDKETALDIQQFGNPDLTYEKKHEFNVGVDLGLLNNRINVTFDWWMRNNFDLIGPRMTTGVGGSITKYANVATMKSHGEELSISTKNIVAGDFKWNTDFIFSHNKTEVTDLDSRSPIYYLTGQNQRNGFTMVGYPYRALWSIDFQGLDEHGLPTFINQDGNLTTSDHDFQSYVLDHLVYEGPTDPTITGSLGNTFTYKNLHLNVFASYSFGNVVRLDPVFRSSYSDLDAMPKEFNDRWVVGGDELKTNIPVLADRRMNQADPYLSYAYNAYNYSTARIAKGDFIRMKEISLSYDVPASWINPLGINSLNLKLQGTNLFLIYSDSKLNGQDPEFFNTGGVAVPMARQFTFTLRAGL